MADHVVPLEPGVVDRYVACSVTQCGSRWPVTAPTERTNGAWSDPITLRASAAASGWAHWTAAGDLFPAGREVDVCPDHAEQPCRGVSVCSTCALAAHEGCQNRRVPT